MRKNEFFEILDGKTHIFTRFWMVNLADSRSPWGVLGALGGVLGGPWEVQSRLWEGSGGSQGTGHRTWRLQGGVWEPTSATPWSVHVHQIHIFVRYFDDFENRRFFRVRLQGGGSMKCFEGCYAFLGVRGTVQGGAPTFFWAPGVPLGAAKVRTMTNFEVNPALILKVSFFIF